VVGEVCPKLYAAYLSVNKRGEKSLLVECYNAIYGTMVAGVNNLTVIPKAIAVLVILGQGV
jgi:hypothetical protein